ncbi:bacteriodes thetaiotaomicron symbiotic chitinase [Beauveria bassiana ARSEF 2860]|uniref:Bacteriodes thetaiotaomicron symbiotic chitinase n=1 Tax=Beauveria bassiana (strain ARSEF 2860) TaxID=655819 RepID=J4VV43_BEAB2|nr:bacteriodes thetaiotaomicron symbiotic chitinase [Beauveria bassiana ARSEF 2860]EJP62340.1 bacteriodes thetaiotaomicron symbiotic chitinase [Beauveria bassiana ARSEF 2860]
MRFAILISFAAMAMAATVGEFEQPQVVRYKARRLNQPGADQSPEPTAEVQDNISEIEGPVEISACYWEGSAPFCEGRCKPGWRQIGRDKCGDGKCCWRGTKAHCCKD